MAEKTVDELERRWLVLSLDRDVLDPAKSKLIRQAYLDGSSDVRVRVVEPRGSAAPYAELTQKSGRGKKRRERNLPTDHATATFLMDSTPLKVCKRRHVVDGKWEVDVFKDSLTGLILAEYEAENVEELDAVTPPPWMREAIEVTETLTNRDLAKIAADLGDDGRVDPRSLARRVPSVVITGGPCSGKSSLMRMISAGDASLLPGRFFHCVPEVATIVIGQVGAHPPLDDAAANRKFQRGIYRVQKTFEAVSRLHARRSGQSALIMDRGSMDGAAYMAGGVTEFEKVARTTAADEYADYDAVIIMMPPPREVYERDKANNPARFETFEQAMALHHRTMAAWRGHPNIFLVDGHTWERKAQAALNMLEAILKRT